MSTGWSKKKFYVTAPIFYANAKPHIWNAYTGFIADLYARGKRMLGYDVKFLMGTDENGQKMTQEAEKAWMSVSAFLDSIAGQHKQMRDDCRMSYTDFIRTTEERHHTFVKKMLQKTYDNWDIYQWTYVGKYCIWCEGFKKDADLVEEDWKLVCPDHGTVPQEIDEKNWFFALSDYQEKLEQFFKDSPDFCSPDFRFNEIKNFVAWWLEDFSISREWSSFWITLPFDDDSVTYIRFDALYNYLTVCQWWDEEFRTDWEVIHVLGKDISRFHSIFWPAMLMSVWESLPDKEIINGFLTVDGKKMSKSIGNTLYTDQLIEEYGRDALVYYLFVDIKIGNDWDFSHDRFEDTKENVLKKAWWNLVSRVVTLAKKNEVDRVEITQAMLDHITQFAEKEWHELTWLWSCVAWESPFDAIQEYLDTVDITHYLRERFHLVQFANKYIDTMQPWKTGKDDPKTTQQTLQLLLWLIKNLWIISAPFLIESFAKLKDIIQIDHPAWNRLHTDTTMENTEIFEEIMLLQQFDTKFGESKYLY